MFWRIIIISLSKQKVKVHMSVWWYINNVQYIFEWETRLAYKTSTRQRLIGQDQDLNADIWRHV